jgi:hypothetical protein
MRETRKKLAAILVADVVGYSRLVGLGFMKRPPYCLASWSAITRRPGTK